MLPKMERRWCYFCGRGSFAHTFDIFSGEPANAMCLEAVRGLENATQGMKQIAAKEPGTYFLFWIQGHGIVDRVDTSKKILEQAETQVKKAGAA